MASSSSSQKTLKLNIPPLDQEEEEEKDRDWLKLGLGFGDACRKQQNQEEVGVQECDLLPNPVPLSSAHSLAPELPFSSQVQADHHQKQPEPSLGLGLGLDNECSRKMDHHGVPLPSCNYLSLCQNQENNYESDPSWPLGSGNFPPMHDDWQLQIPNNLHDYSTTDGGRRRPQQYPAGIWFTLQSYTNQKGEELPQIPKAYIRVKDENVNVLMVKKYLLTKLGLSNETEIEISCMGEKLLQGQTLKHVRDNVWLPKLVESVNPTSDGHMSSTENFRHRHASSVNYLMSLHYGRPDPPFVLKHY